MQRPDASPVPPPFAAAAAALEASTPPTDQPEPVRALLQGLGLGAGDAALLRIAARVAPVFRLPAPDAPGLVAFGAAIDLAAATGLPAGSLPLASASGVGETPAVAFRACMGEAAELLGTVETPAIRASARPARPRAPRDAALAALLAALPWPGGRMRSAWHPARRVTDGATVWLPRELLFRAPEHTRAFPPPWPLSLGCAAGPTPDHAVLHGLLELLERDAAALWWRGGLPGRAIPLEDPAQPRAAALLARLRGARSGERRSWLLDISGAMGVAVVAAISVGPEGNGFCCGLAARTGGLAPAAEAAVLEMAQMELAQALVARKAALRGEAALTPADLAHRRRHAGVHAARLGLLHPRLPPAPPAPIAPETTPSAEALAALLLHLAARGFAPLVVNHGAGPEPPATDCIPVRRVLCPGLETESVSNPGPRLAAAISRTGGGAAYRQGFTLT